MHSRAISRTWRQILHPTFRSVFMTGVAAALVTLLVLISGLYSVWPESLDFSVQNYDQWMWGTQWIGSAINGMNNIVNEWIIQLTFIPIVLLCSYFLFPPVAVVVMGIFLDKIVHAVEEEYYPGNMATRHVGLSESVVGGLRLALLMILLNLLALIPYIVLLFTTGGIGTMILYLAINGYLLGRENFELVASGHMDIKEVRIQRKRFQSKIFTSGVLISAMFIVPFVNILAPIVATAFMTHVFHRLQEDI